MKRFRKVLSTLLAAILACSALAAVPVSAEEVADGTDTDENKVFYFDVKSVGWEAAATKGVFCHIYRCDGKEMDKYTAWQTKGEACTYDSETGIATYDIQTGVNKGATGLNDIDETNSWCIMFSSKSGDQTYPLLMNSSCFGDTVYAPSKDVMLEHNVDSEKILVETKWKNSDLGIQKIITSTGKIQGDMLAYGETDESILAEFILNYYSDEEKMSYVPALLEELAVTADDVMTLIVETITESLGENPSELEVYYASQKLEEIANVLFSDEDGSDDSDLVDTEMFGDFEYAFISDDEIEIYSYYGEDADLAIPSEMNGYTVVGISDYAFYGCETLVSVTIPDTVEYISESAFESCESLTSIVIPDSVTDIGNWAFYGCTSLENITIPDSVTNIDDWAFYGCTSLENITIPDSVEYFGSCVFDETAWYENQPDGVLYVGNYAYGYKGDMPENTTVTIKDGTVGIVNDAFSYSEGLVGVEIPDSVMYIGTDAFCGCYCLLNIDVSEGNEYFCSVDGVLFDKDKSELIQYPIGKEDESYTIPESVMLIGQSAFGYSENLTEIIIPESVFDIGEYAFVCCGNLASVTISDGVLNIGACAFEGCTRLTEVVLPETVEIIGKWAFAYCENLETIVIPDSVTYVGGFAFDCTPWYENQPDGVVYTGKCVYAYKGEMPENTTVIIDEETAGISDSAFEHCDGLVGVEIPDSVTYIGDDAFQFCTNLKEVVIPDSVTYIGDCAFGYYYDEENGYFTQMEDFTIYGYTDSAAQYYAEENAFDFVAVDGETLMGDINGDGAVNVEDATYLQRVIAQYYTLTEEQELVADVNGDGEVNVNDVSAIQRITAGFKIN